MAKIATHRIENLTNSPYPMRTTHGYDRIIPAFTAVEDTPHESFFTNLNKHFWSVKELELSDEVREALEQQKKAEDDRAAALLAHDAALAKAAEEEAIAEAKAAEERAKADAEELAKVEADKKAAKK